MIFTKINILPDRKGRGTYDDFFSHQYKNIGEAHAANDYIVVNLVKDAAGIIHFEFYHSNDPDYCRYHRLIIQHFIPEQGIDTRDDWRCQEIVAEMFEERGDSGESMLVTIVRSWPSPSLPILDVAIYFYNRIVGQQAPFDFNEPAACIYVADIWNEGLSKMVNWMITESDRDKFINKLNDYPGTNCYDLIRLFDEIQEVKKQVQV